MSPTNTPPRGLRVRKLADRSGGDETREADLPSAPPGTWPLDGIEVIGDPPIVAKIPLPWARRAAHDGWISFEGPRIVQRPAGPPDDPMRDVHTFTHADAIVLHTVTGDIRYRVTHQPDKYHTDSDEATVTSPVYRAGGTRVDWFFVAELED